MYIWAINEQQHAMKAATLKSQLVTMVAKYKASGLCYSEYRRMMKKATILAAHLRMDRSELMDVMFAAN